ncbi:BatD family protein [Luteimonas lutimaris]|uniref:BatD family protein n=1 Tax=Luteimonas lutimaris TaxID=698645 RepID=A0ABP7M9M1_9GAMM
MPRWLTWWLCALLATTSLAAHAQTRAWIDRDSVALGETLTLNVETDDPGAGAPDWSPLDGDFIVSGNSSSRQVEIVNGKRSARLLFGVALQPRREGLLTIPALQVGKQRTQPILLTVTEAAPPARAGADAFIEAQLDDEDPYVQQAVGYTLRLYYAMPLVSGQLDQDAPDGASLQRVGSDLQYTRLVGGKRYTVVERRFLLVPERSGPMTIPGARFSGRSAGGFFDDMFGSGTRELSANGAPRFVTVRPVPAKAPQPWLPLRGLGLRYLATPQQARAGEAATVTIEARADGATASQLPEIELPAVDGAQVFAEPAQTDETFDNGRPQVTVTRKFSIVPSREGALRIPGPRIAWWDVRAGVARTATLPDVQLQVAPGATGGATDAVPGNTDVAAAGDDDSALPTTRLRGDARIWAWATAGFALLWLATLVWALQRRAPAAAGDAAASRDAGPARAGLRELRRALDSGDFADVAEVLCAMADPPAADLDAVRARLDDPAQRDAVAQLQRARWGDGDGPAARAGLRAAFAKGPRWRGGDDGAEEPLPPLYPQR